MAWETMLGEMYVLVAIFAIRAISSVGPTRYPTRIPGHTVFENDDAYTTVSPSIDSIVGRGEPANRSAAYGSSSKIVNPWPRATSSSVWRFESDSVQPAGV